MKMNAARSALLLASLVGLAGCRSADDRAWAEAQRNLEPEAGPLAGFDSYDDKVRTLFAKGYESDVVFRMVCIPSFAPEWLVGIRTTDADGFSAFVLSPEKQIWNTELIAMYASGQITELVDDGQGGLTSQPATNTLAQLQRENPVDFRQIGVAETSAPIDAETAGLLASIWSRMLLDARHPRQSPAGFDGTTYHFSMFIPARGIAGGKCWSPAPNTRTGRLSALGELLAAYVGAAPADRPEILANLRRTAQAWENR